jgi:hypothetical protein
MPKMMNGILQILVIVSKQQQNRFVMPNTTIVACKFKQNFNEPLKKKKHFKNDQTTYQTPMSIQLRRNADQTHRVPSKVIMPILKLQMVYIAPIMTTQTNRYVGVESTVKWNT